MSTEDGSLTSLMKGKKPTVLQLSLVPEQCIDGNDSARKVTPTHDDDFPAADDSSTKDTDDDDLVLWREARYRKEEAPGTVSKRTDYISWDDYFMAAAILSSHRSKDPSHASGACLVDPANRIIGTGYNGFPAGCDDDLLPWNNAPSPGAVSPWLHTKNPYVVSAEINAILNKCSADCCGARLYAQWFPGHECAKVIIQSGVNEVIYMDHAGDSNGDTYRASRILLAMANVTWRQYQPDTATVALDFEQALAKDAGGGGGAISSRQPVVIDSETRTNFETTSKEATLRNLLVREANYDPVAMGSSKRANYLSWDDYFLSMAFLTARRSKDPNTQVGACIVDNNKRIVGLGYNGFPTGCSDDVLPWARQADSILHTKYAYVCHAEVNSILNKGSANVQGAALYVALFPCNECAKIIIQAGIRTLLVSFLLGDSFVVPHCHSSYMHLEQAKWSS
jgi:dCMP deaminase